jgi:hypothetical protein
MQAVAVPDFPKSDVIAVDGNYPALAVGLVKVLLPLMAKISAVPDASRTTVKRIVEENPSSVGVFREELLRYIRPNRRQLGTGFLYVSDTEEIRSQAERMARAMETFGIGHEYVHVVRAHHRRAHRTTCARWAEELEADFLSQQILDRIISRTLPIGGVRLQAEERNAGLLNIAIAQALDKAYSDPALQEDETTEMSRAGAFQDALDIVQLHIASGQMDAAAERLSAFGCATAKSEHPKTWLRQIAVFRGLIETGVEGDSFKSPLIGALVQEMWKAVRDDVHVAVANRDAVEAPRITVLSPGDQSLATWERAREQLTFTNALRMNVRTSVRVVFDDVSSGSATAAPLDSVESRSSYEFVQRATHNADSDEAAYERVFRLVSLHDDDKTKQRTFGAGRSCHRGSLQTGT